MLPLKNLVLLLFTFFYSALYAQEIYKIEPYSQKIVLDGQDKEAVWSQLPFSENFVRVGMPEISAEHPFTLDLRRF